VERAEDEVGEEDCAEGSIWAHEKFREGCLHAAIDHERLKWDKKAVADRDEEPVSHFKMGLEKLMEMHERDCFKTWNGRDEGPLDRERCYDHHKRPEQGFRDGFFPVFPSESKGCQRQAASFYEDEKKGA